MLSTGHLVIKAIHCICTLTFSSELNRMECRSLPFTRLVMMVVDEDEATTPIKDKILGWFKLLQRKKPPLAMTKKTFTIAVKF